MFPLVLQSHFKPSQLIRGTVSVTALSMQRRVSLLLISYGVWNDHFSRYLNQSNLHSNGFCQVFSEHYAACYKAYDRTTSVFLNLLILPVCYLQIIDETVWCIGHSLWYSLM